MLNYRLHQNFHFLWIMAANKNSPSTGRAAQQLQEQDTAQSNAVTDAEIMQWVGEHELARGRQWKDVGPLTLAVLKRKMAEQYPHLPELTHENARTVCCLLDTLSLQLCCEYLVWRWSYWNRKFWLWRALHKLTLCFMWWML